MKRFTFRLERILSLRSQTERERARALGSALQVQDEQRRLLDDANARLLLVGDQIAASASLGVQTAGTMHNLGLTVSDAAERVEAASTSHEEAQAKVHEEEDCYREARKDLRMLEKLRERRRTLWNMESSREEQKDIDSQARHQRRAGEQG